MSFYDRVLNIARPIVKALFRVSVTHGENMPQEGSLMVCSNHASYFDPVVLTAFLPRRVHFMCKKEIFKIPLLGRFIKAMGAFPVDRGNSDVKAIKTTISYIKNGDAVGIFPQGTRYSGVDPSTTGVKSGVGMIACRAGCDVLPVFVKAKGNKVRLFSKTEIIIGEVIKNEEFDFSGDGRKEYDKASRYIFSRICALGGYELRE